MEYTPRKRILIIGAGPSGLVSCKEALDNGMDPIIFEKTSNIGGLWNPETGSVWPNMSTNLSKYTCSFTQFPWDDDQTSSIFPSSLEMYNYLLKYSNHFNLYSKIKFNHIVEFISKSKSSGGWLVEWLDDKKIKNTDTFYGVIICSGIFSKYYTPDIPSLQNFKGIQIHSKNYKDGTIFKNKIVLVVGGGISGEQIASDLSNYAMKVIHNFRKPFWLLNPYLPLNSSDNESPVLPLDFLFYNRKFYSHPSMSNPNELRFKKNIAMNTFCQAQQNQQLCPELHIPETDFSNPITVTISNQYLNAVLQETILPKRGNIIKFEDDIVCFENGDKFIIDAIVFSTGFQVKVPFLSKEILNILKFNQNDQFQPMILYNATLHPELPNLYFVGMYKGPYFAVMELQARWACRLLSKKINLPSKEEIVEGLKNELEIREYEPRGQFPHPDYVKFADGIAHLACSFPDLVKLKELNLANSLDPNICDNLVDLEKIKDDIYDKFMTGPVIPEHYNLFNNPRDALEKIDKVIAVMEKFKSKS